MLFSDFPFFFFETFISLILHFSQRMKRENERRAFKVSFVMAPVAAGKRFMAAPTTRATREGVRRLTASPPFPPSSQHSFLLVGGGRRRHSVKPLRAMQEKQVEVSHQVDVDLGERSYPIYIGENLMSRGDLLTKHIPGKQVSLSLSSLLFSFTGIFLSAEEEKKRKKICADSSYSSLLLLLD